MWLTNFEKTSCLKAERSKIEGAVDRIEDFVYWECFIVGKDVGETDILIIGSCLTSSSFVNTKGSTKWSCRTFTASECKSCSSYRALSMVL